MRVPLLPLLAGHWVIHSQATEILLELMPSFILGAGNISALSELTASRERHKKLINVNTNLSTTL